MSSRLVGDWKKAGIVLKNISTKISPLANARLYADGKIIVEKMVEHIDKQDLPWTPLKQHTIQLKGNEKVYYESGWLRDNLSVRRLKNNPRGSTIFIGASPWKKHPQSGLTFSDLMIFLEYGTRYTPARPLVRPTWNELEEEIKQGWADMIKELLGGQENWKVTIEAYGMDK